MTIKEASEILGVFDFNKITISGKARDVAEYTEACAMGAEALEKQIPKKPNEYYDGYADGHPVIEFECPNCGAELEADFDHHCRCGQAIDWSEEVEE